MPQNDVPDILENLQIDRWHFFDFDKKHIQYYVEWKYFNFIQKDLAGYIIYYILDPEVRTKFGGGRLLVRIFKNGSSFGGLKKLNVADIQFDPKSASVEMAKATIIEKDSFEYDINGNVEDIAWSLTFKQKSPTIESFTNVNPGYMKWEKVNWLIKMPKAEVHGNIKIGNEVIDIKGLGYSDTNWGEVMPLFSKYEWGQYNDKDISFVFGMLYGLTNIKNTYFYLFADNSMISLEKAECRVEHLEWTRDSETGLKMPSHSSFVIRENDYVVKFSTRLASHDVLGLKISALLPKTIVSEQVVHYKGYVEKAGKRIYEFDGKGFEEWSTKTFRNIPLLF